MSAKERLGIRDTLVSEARDHSEAQRQTSEAFSFKWSKRDTYESPAMAANAERWLMERYCGDDPTQLDRWLEGGRKIILDAGCGSGFSALLFFGKRLRNHDYLGVDISDAVEVAEERFAEAGVPGEFLQSDLADLPISDGSVDIVFSEGVLHHTDDTGKSIEHLARKLKPGGRFMFYVYRRKAVLREFTDDYVRACLRDLDDESAWEMLRSLTKLGIALGELDVEIDVPEDIPLLGIEAGRLNIQRFFYWNVLKAFYRPEFSFEEMHHINFDWYRPLNCHRHTPAEVKGFCDQAGLDIERMDIQPAGITVVASRRSG